MHYFITGHTGFKGSWLTLLLKRLGHEVSGYSLAPRENSLFRKAEIEKILDNHFIGDIRDLDSLTEAASIARPDVAIHLAAQALVIKSYEDPIETYSTNVDGTRNFLEVISRLEKRPVSLVITTDKVYRNEGKDFYTESDPLGGHDPYSASKAMADILTSSWAQTNPELIIKVARAGNVIGAFDDSENRLIPDSIRSLESGLPLLIRNPGATRPWQHVLDCLVGYLRLVNLSLKDSSIPTALNFGPPLESVRTVRDVVNVVQSRYPKLEVQVSEAIGIQKESQKLALDSSLAQERLGWTNKLGFNESILWTLEEHPSQCARGLTENQIERYIGIFLQEGGEKLSDFISSEWL